MPRSFFINQFKDQIMNMKNKYLLFSLLCLFVFAQTAHAQLYSYGSAPDGVPATVAINADATGLTRVNDASSSTGCPDGFNSNRFAEGTTFLVSRPAVEFTVTPEAGYQLDVTGLKVDARRNNKGPVLWRLAYSTDGGTTWIDNGSDFTVNEISCGTPITLAWDFADFSAASSVIFRIYAYGAVSNLNGVATMRNVILSGAVNFTDADGDGFTSDLDCNDTDPGVNPGAADLCNGIDDDCNGIVDDGANITVYADADDDGFGNPAVSIEVCAPIPGYVLNDNDCNDANGLVNPDGVEVCNGLDDDCDGDVDEGLLLNFYADIDADGFGNPVLIVESCSAPVGYVNNSLDCNDFNDLINPAAVEACNGIDDNCNGTIDEGALVAFYADADGDGFGDVAVMVEACTAPVGFVENNDDCNDASADVNPLAVEVCGNGIDDNCDGIVDISATITALGPTTFCAGGSVTLSCATPAVDAAYQWFKNGNPIAGATESNYTTTVQGNYRCQVTSGACVVSTSVITVTVNLTPNATIAPLDGLDLCGKPYVRLRGNNGTGLTYQWNLNGTVLAGATSQLYFATSVGTYRLKVTNASGCTKVSAPVSVFTSCREGIGEEGSLSIMPNPSDGRFTIQLPTTPGTDHPIGITIYTQAGSMVYHNELGQNNGGSTAEITLDPVPGLYIIVVESEGVLYREKLVIVK